MIINMKYLNNVMYFTEVIITKHLNNDLYTEMINMKHLNNATYFILNMKFALLQLTLLS